MVFTACKDNPLLIDVSDVKVDVQLQRFDQDLFNASSQIDSSEIYKLQGKYGVFFNDFTQNIINIGNINTPQAQYHLNGFVNDTYIKEIKQKSDNLYADFSPYHQQIEKAFKYYHYYFPNKKIPQLITFISGYNYAVVTDNSYLGVGLDMFLGANHKDYNKLGFPKYKSNFMTPDYLATGVMLGWISTEFVLNNDNADLLTEMIHQGKIMYVLDALFPKADDGKKINYNQEQIAWSEKNEKQVWYYFIDNDLLYTKKTSDIIKFMGESPFIQGFPEGSPGRVGHWIGWQIVRAYMKQHPETNLQQLMNINEAQEILTKSKYKP